jgi:hypothetical protein
LLGAELHAPRTEVGQPWHIVAVGLPLDFAPPGETETGPELARRARAALKAGHFYSSTGPELYDVRIEGDVVVVRCSPATKVLLSGGTPGAEVAQGTDLTECSLPLTMFRGTHCRITIEDTTGARAWTNPIHLPANLHQPAGLRG